MASSLLNQATAITKHYRFNKERILCDALFLSLYFLFFMMTFYLKPLIIHIDMLHNDSVFILHGSRR